MLSQGILLVSMSAIGINVLNTKATTNVSGGITLLSAGTLLVSGGITLLSSAYLPVTNYPFTPGGGVTSTWIYAALSSGINTAVWTPAAAKKFVVTDINVTADAAGTITVTQDSGTIVMMKFTLGANGGYAANYNTPYIATTTKHCLYVKSGVAGTATYVWVSGYEQ